MKIVAKSLLRDRDGNLLLLRRSPTHPNFPKHIDFPGGEVEPGESYIEAALREIQEETGLVVPMENIQQVYSKQLFDDLLHIIFLADVSESKPHIELSWEHSEFKWMPLAQLSSITLPENVDGYHLTVLNYLELSAGTKLAP